ncbi:nucleotidyl transferase AbiEii/AbiGii toxin family protein [Patescibacteria group bacterium]|nr:nucleotidyl transferase AbiEii/AbiGii toxin family protein [Patescibacteria group bacterium]MBU4275045.1 nucleotidyl transferase AbiEii/AbiGii toxin family protein [Patescibacteria group bacterium]MBU4367478.1 nucleotidyl transferase AbiEii/AbiGii toxin family protein [Patescibacteria group bacterium]MBU4462084.1 nucleotidyl transferase AbiEii/AbiGii toxin family protein [Patescibacteria group bacterium]MCG2700470.1 nucleotidyl transferase AbiEii/AbiGii toxin family protein [Candidatus Parcu
MYLEAIGSKRQKVFQKLKEFRGFYLVGGTALALQIGHRVSVDFDLFSNKKISPNFLDKVEKVFKDYKISVVINNSNQLTVKIDKIKIDFVKYLFPPILGFINYQGVNILKISEIAAMKANVLGRRPSLKDYIDLYFILKDKYIDLNGIISIAEKKYKDEFNGRLFLEQLIYLQDVREMRINFLKESVSKQQLHEFFEEEIKKIKLG